MKKICLFASLLIIVALACDVSVAVEPTITSSPLPANTVSSALEFATQLPPSATLLPATDTPSVPTQSFEGVEVTIAPLNIILPPGLAVGVSGSQAPRAEGEDIPVWGVTPGHTIMQLEGYLLQGKFHQPQIFIFPALAYAEMVPGAFESLHRLNNILYDPNAPISPDQLPIVPFFNAQQVFATNIQPISFQNGQGIRFLTEYAQYAASANNNDLFYHFQGLTRDGAYYIIAILPITVPLLAETSDGGAPLPPGGVPYPYFAGGTEADMELYYKSVTDLLNATPPEAFTPTINQLDALIRSMHINQ